MCALVPAILLAAWPASAHGQARQIGGGEFRPLNVGEPVEREHMRVSVAVYPSVAIHGLRAEGVAASLVRGKEDIHVACHVRARTGNPYGFRSGDWVPDLNVHFTLTHQGSGTAVEGQLFPMVARDGPHYGMNIQMLGEGDYTLVLFLRPPSAKRLTRVTGEPAGVPDWWAPFDAAIEFTYRSADVFAD